jgi:hypothetical protein
LNGSNLLSRHGIATVAGIQTQCGLAAKGSDMAKKLPQEIFVIRGTASDNSGRTGQWMISVDFNFNDYPCGNPSTWIPVCPRLAALMSSLGWPTRLFE